MSLLTHMDTPYCSRAWIYTGKLYHKRVSPTVHEFTYPCLNVGIDLSQWHTLTSWWMTTQGRGIFSLNNTDFLTPENKPLTEKITFFLKEHYPEGLIENHHQILLTQPKFLGFGFNPVSFILIFNQENQLKITLADVHNTFSERHIYLLTHPKLPKPEVTQFTCDKQFHVSPFFDQKGRYTFDIQWHPTQFHITISYYLDQTLQLVAEWGGKSRPLTPLSIKALGIKFSWSVIMTFPRILIQAFWLKFKRKLPIFKKPMLTSTFSSSIKKTSPSLLQKLCFYWGVWPFFKKIRHGHIKITLPDGQVYHLGDTSFPEVDLQIKEWAFFTKSALFGEIGFGESYVDGDWDSSNLTHLLTVMIDNLDVLEGKDLPLARKLLSKFNDYIHFLRPNTLKKSKKHIQAHYDLSNDLFSTFLDPSFTYSSAIFESPTDSLEKAQHNKINRIIKNLNLNEHHHVLEIGCGWGSLAIEMVKASGCRVTGITLSEAQLQLANQRIQNAGLSDRISLKLCDYRQVEGEFDRIVSIEMIEAVGHQYLPIFFQKLEKLLNSTGIIFLQSITIAEHRSHAYKNEADWIQKYIFPGGYLPSLSELERLIETQTSLNLQSALNIGHDYALTLAEWRKRFVQNLPEVIKLGFNEVFIRKWIFYFCYCEAGFLKSQSANYQLVLSR